MKRASKRKTVSKVKKKAAPKKAASKAKKKAAPKKAAAAKAALGCCTLIGSGPDQQFERITRDACKRKAIAASKNYQWVAGVCAQPS